MKPCAPAAAPISASLQARLVEPSTTVSRTGMRPAATRSAVFSTSTFSSISSVEASPSEPHTMRPSTPACTWKAKLFSISAMSRRSSAVNLVVTAGKTPVQMEADAAMAGSWVERAGVSGQG